MDPDDVMTRASEPPDAVLRYADHDDGLVDVHLPAGPATERPLVVFVHGGFWRQEYDRVPGRPLANALVASGLVVASVEYRRGPGSWAATSTDLDAALSSLPALLDGIGVTTSTTTLVGHSAGGHLVLWLANQPHPHHRVVALAPVADLRAAAEHELGSGAAVDFLAGTPESIPETYDAADPATRMRVQPGADVIVVHGDEDQEVPVVSSRDLAATFPWVDYRELPRADHYAVIDPLSTAWPAVLAAIRG